VTNIRITCDGRQQRLLLLLLLLLTTTTTQASDFTTRATQNMPAIERRPEPTSILGATGVIVVGNKSKVYLSSSSSSSSSGEFPRRRSQRHYAAPN